MASPYAASIRGAALQRANKKFLKMPLVSLLTKDERCPIVTSYSLGTYGVSFTRRPREQTAHGSINHCWMVAVEVYRDPCPPMAVRNRKEVKRTRR
jgi:hypothetical protein